MSKSWRQQWADRIDGMAAINPKVDLGPAEFWWPILWEAIQKAQKQHPEA